MIVYRLFFLLFIIAPIIVNGAVHVGIGKTEITPPTGTPSAGYSERKGAGMEGTHDPLLALALFINNGEKNIVLCSIDHLGFTYEMVQNIIQTVHSSPGLADCEVYIASSHTHSGGGAHLDIPVIGESLAGPYDPQITHFYEERTAQAIIQASQTQVPAKIGVGYGKTADLSHYRSLWPTEITPSSEVAIIKATTLEGEPLALLFNYPLHPTTLDGSNTLFSSDFVGYARDEIQTLLGSTLQTIYFNGAQGDVIPKIPEGEDRFIACENIGKQLATSIKEIWDGTEVDENLDILTDKISYSFQPQTTPFGLCLPFHHYSSEMNILLFNQRHAFITIPGELSCIYDHHLKELGTQLGYSHVSIFGLTNDAHGYIILPESWKHKTFESKLSFGGEFYGDEIINRAELLLYRHMSHSQTPCSSSNSNHNCLPTRFVEKRKRTCAFSTKRVGKNLPHRDRN